MKMYIEVTSKNKIGYTPDWVKLYYAHEGKNYELTLDAMGVNDFHLDGHTTKCRFKGDLVPWLIFDEDGNEKNLFDIDQEIVEKSFSETQISELFKKSTITIGIFPTKLMMDTEKDDDDILEEAENDEVSEGKGKVIFNANSIINFDFETELNVN